MNDYDQEIIAHLKLESPSIGHHRLICPCAASRKPANRRERTLSVDVDFERVVFYCQHCEGRGAYSLKDTGFVPKTYSPPAPMKKLDITKARDNSAQEWLENERLIPAEIHQRYGVKFVELYGDPAVAFVYGNPRKGAKLRKIEEKRFAVDGKLEDPYLWEYIDFEKDYLIICEGEVDALSIAASGFDNIISVPHGASNSQRDDNQKLSFLSSHADKFYKFKKITLACDNDEPGIALQNELARRLGRPRCFGWSPPEDCKDANTVLSKRGVEALKRSIEEAKPYRTPGIERASVYKADLIRFRMGEIGGGFSTGLKSLDPIFKMSRGLLTVFTGKPGHGKSELCDSIHIHMAKEHGWKTGIWSAENPPHAHIAKLVEKYHHKKFHLGAPNQMSDEDVESGSEWVDKHFFFLTQEGDNTPASIVERLEALVMSEGIQSAVIDPFNFISLPGIKREDQEISDMLTLFLNFCKQREVHLSLIAHPRSVQNGTIPDGSTVAGGATWAAKADFGLTVYREDGVVTVRNWKTRWSHLGMCGDVELGYDTKTADYYDLGSNPAPSKNRYLDDDEILW
jgi:twinkle protein